MSNLNDFLQAQAQSAKEGTLKDDIFKGDDDANETIGQISIAMTQIAVSRMVEEAEEDVDDELSVDGLEVMRTIFAASHASLRLGFQLGIRWAASQELESRHA